MSKLLQHFGRMKAMCAAYIETTPSYTDIEGKASNRGPVGLEPAERNWLFANDMVYMLDGPEQRAAEADILESGFERVRNFHEAFALPVNESGYLPTVEERLLRGNLMLEEVLEHLLTGLGLRLSYAAPNGSTWVIAEAANLSLVHRGDPYNPVETLDGLCDVKVIANGTGVAFGLPVEAADKLIYESNMSKLGPDGKPIINGVTVGYRWIEGRELPEAGHRPDLPVGKVLKPDTYVAPDIASLLK